MLLFFPSRFLLRLGMAIARATLLLPHDDTSDVTMPLSPALKPLRHGLTGTLADCSAR